MHRHSVLAVLLSAAMGNSPALAGISEACAKIADQASLNTVNRIPVIGQTMVLGRPFAIKQGVLRVEVEVFGPQTQVYAVDVTIDRSCRVLATSTRLESEAEPAR
jgi:hypothetical protein